MKVGDLVELLAFKPNIVIGLIVGVMPNVHPIFNVLIVNVLIDGSIHPVMKNMLEVISESR